MTKEDIILDEEFTRARPVGIIARITAIIRVFVILLFIFWMYRTFDSFQFMLTTFKGPKLFGALAGAALLIYLFIAPMVYYVNQIIQEFQRSPRVYLKRRFRLIAVLYSSLIFIMLNIGFAKIYFTGGYILWVVCLAVAAATMHLFITITDIRYLIKLRKNK